MNASIINSDSSNSVSGFIKTITDFSVKIYDYLLYGIPLATNEEDGKTIKSILQSNVDSRLLSSSDNYIQRQYEASNNTISRVVRNLMDARVQMILKSPNRKDISVNTFRCAILNEAYRPGKEHHKTVHNLLTVAAQKAEEEGANSEIYEMLNTLACLALGKGSIDFFKMIEACQNKDFQIDLKKPFFDPFSKKETTALALATKENKNDVLDIIKSYNSQRIFEEITDPIIGKVTFFKSINTYPNTNTHSVSKEESNDHPENESPPQKEKGTGGSQGDITPLFTPGTASEMLQKMPSGKDSGTASLRREFRLPSKTH